MLSCKTCLWQLNRVGRRSILISGNRVRCNYIRPSRSERSYASYTHRGNGNKKRSSYNEEQSGSRKDESGASALRRASGRIAYNSSNRTVRVVPAMRNAKRERSKPTPDYDKRHQYNISKPGYAGPAEAYSPQSWLRSTQALSQRKRYIAATRRNIQEDTMNDEAAQDERRARMELKFLKDPLALADRIRSLLKDADAPEPAKAYSMVRIASRTIQCTVAWNHVMDFEMSKGRISVAMKAYNEMKKRAQEPDSYTYMILLRGMAEHAQFAQSLGKALSLYHSMASPNSRVRPTIKHTNVVLKVCARAEDMDALWGVAAKIPDKGSGAADGRTFTTILNAIRLKAVTDEPHGLTVEQSARRRESAIIEGRRIWDAVIQKWRAGEILIDENLTCAMGRLLLIGARPRDWDDVFSLVQQTMNIPRLLPKLGTTARGMATHIPVLKAPYTPADMREEDLSIKDKFDEWKAPEEKEVRLEPRGEFDPVEGVPQIIGGMGQNYDQTREQETPLGYAQPRTNTLSLVMEACLKSIARRTAEDYWALLTGTHGYAIEPDSDNVHMYLRVLRQARASTAAVELLRAYFAPGWDGKASTPAKIPPLRKTFRIVISICVRDKRNRSALQNARTAIELMASSIEDPDARAVAMYLQLVSAAPTEVMLEEVRRLGPTIINLRSFFNYSTDVQKSDEEDILEVFHRLISIYDRLLHHGNLPVEERQELQERKARCTHFVTRKDDRKREMKQQKRSSPIGKQAESRSWRTKHDEGKYRLLNPSKR